jgi:DNA repair ATPase RecN
LEAFGKRVPPEIKEALNLSPINFQWQMDSSFLLSQSSGEVSRYLNEIVNLEDIHLALSNIEKRLRREKREVTLSTEAVENYEKQIKSYDWLSEVQKDLAGLEKLDKEVSKITYQITSLGEQLDWLGHYERDLRGAEDVLKWKSDVEDLCALEQEIEAGQEQIDELADLLDRIDSYTVDLKVHDLVVGCRPELEKLLVLSSEIEELEEDALFLRDDLNNLKDNQEALSNLEKELEQLQVEYDKEMPDVCPLCEQPIKKKRSRRGN